MARVAASMSADTSRLVARKLANRSAKSALFESRRTGMVAFRRVTAQWRGHKPPSTLELAPSVIPGWSQRVGALRRPMTGSGPDPESRDSGFALCAPRNDVSPPYSHRSSTPPRRFGAFAQIAGCKIVGAEIGQLAFQAFDIEPQRAALAEHQERAAAGRITGMKLDPDQFKGCFRRLHVEVARLARQP